MKADDYLDRKIETASRKVIAKAADFATARRGFGAFFDTRIHEAARQLCNSLQYKLREVHPGRFSAH